jgi:hypothetical protein
MKGNQSVEQGESDRIENAKYPQRTKKCELPDRVGDRTTAPFEIMPPLRNKDIRQRFQVIDGSKRQRIPIIIRIEGNRQVQEQEIAADSEQRRYPA